MVTIRGGSDIYDTPALRSDYMGALLRYLPLVYISFIHWLSSWAYA